MIKKMRFTSSVGHPILVGGVAIVLLVSFACIKTTPATSRNAESSITRPAHQRSQQTIFGVEESVTRPVDLPEDVLKILREDKRNRESLEKGQSISDIPASWFAASEINLNEDKLPDLIVIATEPRLFGANLAPFWVFRNTTQGNKLVLSVSALGLEALHTRTNGFRDIRSTIATARGVFTTIFKFDGDAYAPN